MSDRREEPEIERLREQVQRLTEERDTARRDLQEQLAIQRLEAEVIQSLEAARAAKDDALREIAKGSPVYASRGWECQQIARTALGATQDGCLCRDDSKLYCPVHEPADYARTSEGATQKEETPEGWVEVDGRWYNPFPTQEEETNG